MTKEELEEHIHMLKYFYEEKGEMERYVQYKETIKVLKKKCPEFIQAYENMQNATKIFERVLEHIDFYGVGK